MSKKQANAMELTVNALRRALLQGNSQIHNVREWIDDEVAKNISAILSIAITTQFSKVELEEFVESVQWDI